MIGRRTMQAAGLVALLALGGLVAAQAQETHGGDHAGHGMPATDASAATQAYEAANAEMHAAMDIDFTGDPDVDFARGMIGHHEGAIAMARIVLEHGQDPDLRALAEEIIEAQEAEIAFLRDWLASNGS
jgi:uncharacterized protein (DUF305 family)